MIDKFNYYSHESTCIHIPKMYFLCLSKNVKWYKAIAQKLPW